MSDRIKDRIAALLRMTRASDCTEAEALAAAEKAAALMREHGLSEVDITMGQASVRHDTKGRGACDDLWRIVAHCTNTACIFVHVRGERGAAVTFVGPDPGPDLAAYLVAVLNRAIDTAIAEFRTGTFYRRRRSSATRRAAVRDFVIGMVLHLSRRLDVNAMITLLPRIAEPALLPDEVAALDPADFFALSLQALGFFMTADQVAAAQTAAGTI